MAPNSQKEETNPTPSQNQSKTQESQAAPQAAKPKESKVEEITIKAEKPAKKKATTPNNPEGVTQDNDSHYTIR